MFGIGKRRKPTALDELKERLSLPELKISEEKVREFYEGRNPYEHLQTEWPQAYSNFVRGFAYALDRCRKEGIVDFQRREVIASTTGMGLARASFGSARSAA